LIKFAPPNVAGHEVIVQHTFIRLIHCRDSGRTLERWHICIQEPLSSPNTIYDLLKEIVNKSLIISDLSPNLGYADYVISFS